jgi:plastocyanin domain-containing protein
MKGFGSVRRALVSIGALLGAGAVAQGQHLEQGHPQPSTRVVEIVVQDGYKPSEILATEGEHIRLRFVRRESSDCTAEVVFPALEIRKPLPEGQAVTIDLGRLSAGRYEFTCAMGMIRGAIVVRGRS